MDRRNYVSPKAQDHLDGRAERDQHVASYLRTSTPLQRPVFRTVWNDALGRYVEVR